nr:integrase, catalytic region, zinc finger, CCHC-type, peptidase aspartic, catalytic [Tanacetum cinerariifolium]
VNRISLDSMLDKWHRISKGTMLDRMVGFKLLKMQFRMRVFRVVVTLLGITQRPKRKDAAYLQTQLLIAQKEETGIQLQVEEFDFMATACDLDEIEEVNANCILMANLQHASTFGTQLDKAPFYDTDGSAEVQLNDNCYDNEIFNMFTQEEQYTDLFEPIYEPQLVPQNDNHVTSVAPSMVQSGGTVETSSAPNEETRAYQETVYHNLVDQVAQVNMVNCNMRATNAELKSELARYKIQEQRIETSQEKYDKLEKCYQKSIYQEQKVIEEKKRLKHDFKTQEDKFLDKEVDLEAKIKDLENILLIRDQTVQTMHMINPKPNSFYHPDQKMALGYPNPSYLKKAQLKQQSLYNGVFVPQTTKSKEELFLSNVSNMVTVSTTISIPNEDLSDDTTPSVARKFLNEVKNPLVTLQRVVKQKMALEVNNWLSSAHKEADESLDKQKYLELEIERLLKASVSHDVMSIMQNGFADVPSDLQTELDQVRVKVVELEFQVVNYEREISHLKTTYKNLFDSITSNRAHAKLHNLIYENAKIRARLFKNNFESMDNTSGTSVTPHVDKPKLIAVTPHSKKSHASIPSHSVPQPREFNVVKHRNVIAPGMFKIDPSQTSRVVQICLWCVDLGCSKHMTGNIKLLINFVWKFLGTVRFGNDHIAAILGYDDLKWGNITITRVYFVEGLGHNLFLVGQFCDTDLEVTFRRNTCFIRDLDGVDLLKGNRSTNLYTINLYDMASASLINLMACATPTKSWLWHQRLSHLTFDTINDLAKNDLLRFTKV